MKLNFKKISAIGASILMTGMTMGVAAAANFPAPFVDSSGANVAIVYGAAASSLDLAQTGTIVTALQAAMPKSGGAPTGDSVLIAKGSDNLNLGNTWGVLTGSIDEEDLGVLLADGTYVADDNDEFNYEQKITLGTPTFEHFRDSDYETLVGSETRTPALGFKLSSNTFVMNYTLDFTQDAESDVLSGDMDDIEGSDITLLGRSYYVSDFKNGTSTAYFGKLTLLDSASSGTVLENEIKTIVVGGKSYDVSIVGFTDADSVKLMVNGETTTTLDKGQSYKLSDGTYLGIKDASKLVITGSVGSVDFSLGSGKLEITHGSDVRLNDVDVQGVKGYVKKGTGGTATEKIDSIVLEWTTDEEVFLTSEAELLMPGFEAVKFSMADFARPEEEKVTIAPDGDTSIELTVPVKDGDVSLNLLYSSSTTGNFSGIGKASDERLATSTNGSIKFFEKESGSDYHSYFVATYNISNEAESYLLRAKISEDTTNARNETTIDKNVDGSWVEVCKEKTTGDTCEVGDVSLTIQTIEYTSGGNESVVLKAGTNVNFYTIFTAGGLKIWLPYEGANTSSTNGAINFTNANGVVSGMDGYSANSWYLFMDGEDKDDTLIGGTEFNLTIDDTSAKKLHVSEVNNAGSGGSGALEVGTSSGVYEKYMVDDVAPRIRHYTKPDEDQAEVYYPTGDSESYAEVYLTESGSSLGVNQLGDIVVLDSEVSSVSSKNLIVVGGSCINTVAANLLGGAACGPSFTALTDIASGEYIIKSVGDAYTTGKVALVVAGYDAEDTAAGVSYLLNKKPDTIAGTELKGTDSTTATVVSL